MTIWLVIAKILMIDEKYWKILWFYDHMGLLKIWLANAEILMIDENMCSHIEKYY